MRNYSLLFFLLIISVLCTENIKSQRVYDLVVAKDGTGDYIYLSSAIKKYSSTRRIIFIKNGTYKEKLLIDAAKKNLYLIGESVDGVIITFDDYAGKAGVSSTAESYTVKVEADGFYAENITFQNTATLAQAVAIYTKADTIAFKNCRFDGYQDTHYADNGRQYFLNCETKGDVDFIFGSAAAYYHNSTIISGNRKGGYITAPSETVNKSTKTEGGTFYHGILFNNCEITAENGLAANSCYLGRPWEAYSSSVFFNCKIGSHIKSVGWSTWEADNHLNSFMAEYKSKNTEGNLLDVSQRADWSKQLSDSDTSYYSINYYLKGWNPLIKTTSLNPPGYPRISGDSVKWNPVENARGYVILRNDSAIGFSTTSSFYINNSISGIYSVKSVSPHGSISKAALISTKIKKTSSKNYHFYISDGFLITPEFVEIDIFNITGLLVKTKIKPDNKIEINNLKTGVYIARIRLKENEDIITYKFINQD